MNVHAAALIEASAQLALRRLQQIDEACHLDEARGWLLEAEDALGLMLGLQCTGTLEGEDTLGMPLYDHSIGTCPIHEWLDPSDQPEAEAVLERRLAS